jgi:replication-associated recombination protein RarA
MQADLAFPQSLAEKYRPRTIAEFIGLEKPKKILAKFAAKPYPSAWLFVGPPGVGKTSMALALALQMGAELHHLPSGRCNAQSIEETVRLCHYMPMTLGGLHLVLVDEADGMTNPALDATAFPPNTVFVFTCNGTVGLEPRFLSRCRTVEFSSYGMASDITVFLNRVWHSEGGNGNGPDLSRLVKDSRNNVRDALMTLEVELMAL